MIAFRAPALPPLQGKGLVVPPRGATTLALAYMRYLQIGLGSFLELVRYLPPELHAAHEQAARLVVAAHGKSAKATMGCFAATSIGTPLACLTLRDALPAFRPRIDRAGREVLPHLLLELALRKLLGDEHVDVPVDAVIRDPLAPAESLERPPAPLALDSLALGARIHVPEAATTLRFESGTLTALAKGAVLGTLALAPIAEEGDASGFRLERVYFPTGKVTRLALVDKNPIAEFEAHPDKAGNHVDLGDRPASEWTRVLDESFALIERFCPDLFGEMQMMLHEVVPVGFHAERHLSASYREAIGTVYLTLHGNVMTMTEALIHEFQHNKANVAAWSADYLVNAYEPRYKSPVRPDPRPLWGILLAVHAFLPVALLYRRMRAAAHPFSQRPDFERRLSEIDLKNHEGMEMLRAHAEWRPVGKAMFDELDALDRAHMAERAARGLAVKPTEVHLA